MFAAGDVVTARGNRWIVEDATTFPDCTLLTLTRLAHLSGIDRDSSRRECKLLHPFDRPVICRSTPAIRAVTRRRWMRHLHTHLASLRTFGQLRAAPSAKIEILPFQLEPALALIEGRAARFLLADEVGLGKTIQAGLMLAELQHRGWCERALILTPAGLRRQWAEELERRFGICAAVLDTMSVRTLAATLPFGVNPWMVESVTIASIDYVKQPEVLRALTSQLWDILIIDEAHQVATAPLRAAAVRMLAQRARHVALLTATPHAGDEPAYRSLCALGQLDRTDSLLLFRRTRDQVGLKRARRVHLLPVRMSGEALEMHRLLGDYARRLWQIAQSTGRTEVQLVAMVLCKRAYSSAASLAISVERRLAALAGRLPAPAQSDLPFDSEEDPSDSEPLLTSPAFDREEQGLRAILSAAERARKDDRKLAALLRFLRRVPEPAVVFTEYRDTLAALEVAVSRFRRTVVLHGGLNPSERRATVDAFARGAADLLLATDAGSEGLNLQGGCRIVINLELPWNPIRLEQRIGRVDRIGQLRTVHAINLFAEETAESTVLASLVRRLDRIRSSEVEIASCVINRAELQLFDREPVIDGCTVRADLKKESEAEAARLSNDRRMAVTPESAVDEEIMAVTTVRLTAFAKASASAEATADKTAVKRSLSLRPGKPDTTCGSSVIWFVRARIVNGAGRLVEDMLVPVLADPAGGAVSPKFAGFPRTTAEGGQCRRRRDVRAYAEQLVEQLAPAVISVVSKHVEARAKQIAVVSAQWIDRALIRERALSNISEADTAFLIQAGLFDARTLKQHAAAEHRRRRVGDESDARVETLRAAGIVSAAQTPQIAALLIAC
jgi:superfamily II DNA or RNA helicase